MEFDFDDEKRGSLPTRERGLKFISHIRYGGFPAVAPYTGAWIEIVSMKNYYILSKVAPYTGAWIEM